MAAYKCDKCTNGKILIFMHVNHGICFKCNGTSELPYDPTDHGSIQTEEWSEQERTENERELKLIARAEIESWMKANNIDPFDHPYY